MNEIATDKDTARIAFDDWRTIVYVCAEEGEDTVTIEVSDDGFEACIDQWTVVVRCVSGDGS